MQKSKKNASNRQTHSLFFYKTKLTIYSKLLIFRVCLYYFAKIFIKKGCKSIKKYLPNII